MQPDAATLVRAREDFRVFVWLIWHHLGLPDPTPAQYSIAKYLQDGPRRKVICAFRGVGKSWLTSAFVLWLLWKNAEEKILVVSASKDRADAFSTFTKRLLGEVSFLRHLVPEKKKGDRDSNVAFDVRTARPAHAPSVKSVGVYGQLTGSRATYIVFDDAEIPNNSETATQREKLIRRVTEGGGAILTPGGSVTFLGTPQTEDSMYPKLLERGYEMQMWPARRPVERGPYGRLLSSFYDGLSPGACADPNRFDEFELGEREAEYGRAGFALQFMLDTTLSDEDRYPLKCSDLVVMDLDVDVAPDKVVWAGAQEYCLEHLPCVGFHGDRFHRPMHVAEDFSPYTGSVMYVDPSGRGKDETGYAVVKILHGLLYLRRWGGLDGGYEEKTLTKLATIARDEKVNLVMVEDNFGDGMYLELLKPVLRRVYVTKDKGAGCTVEGDRVGGQKEARIVKALEPVLSTHRLIIDESIIRADLQDKKGFADPDAALKTCFHQLTRLTRDRGALKYDDRIDALAGAVRYWTDRMAQDVDAAVKTRHNERLEEELRKFHESFGLTHRPQVWSDRL